MTCTMGGCGLALVGVGSLLSHTSLRRSPELAATSSPSSQLGSRGTKMEGAARFHPAPPPRRLHTKGQPLLLLQGHPWN